LPERFSLLEADAFELPPLSLLSSLPHAATPSASMAAAQAAASLIDLTGAPLFDSLKGRQACSARPHTLLPTGTRIVKMV
jgi:hypothetical protein